MGDFCIDVSKAVIGIFEGESNEQFTNISVGDDYYFIYPEDRYLTINGSDFALTGDKSRCSLRYFVKNGYGLTIIN
ncbi:MAG: hypothetical protein E7578_03990 [Ruminococcaceae bacterium]|nr:hypothetical protein [Oscillospiraceae bacterium]